MESMDDLIKNWIIPYRTHYLMFGSLILLFTLLNLFSENIFSIFLMGLISFAMLVISLDLLLNFFSLKKGNTLLEITYHVFFLFFFISFFLLILTEFGEPFMVALGIFSGYALVVVFREFRWWLIIFHKKIKKRIKVPFWIFNFIILLIYILIVYYLSGLILQINTENLSLVSFFVLPFFFLNLMGLIVFIFLFFRDIFKKKILHYNIRIKSTNLYKIYKKIKKF